MDRNGIRAVSQRTGTFCAARRFNRHRAAVCFLVFACWMMAGCSSQRKNQSIIRVNAKQNTHRANRLTYAGIRELNLGHIDVAAKKFREAIKADFTYGPAHNNLGLMHYEQGNLYQAVTAFEAAREYLPSDPAVVYNLGLALESAGRTDEALDLYYTANQMDRANPHFLGNLTRLRVRLGEHDEQLRQQLKDLVLIETRPEWRRWADHQLGLTMNAALDRGPKGPDLETAANETAEPRKTNIRDKIIDLTPVAPASYEETDAERPEEAPPLEPSSDKPLSDKQPPGDGRRDDDNDELSLESSTPTDASLPGLIDETTLDELSEEAYFREN
ncbi:MAG: tetratricopeptide repeat protein [Planctomycetota bacterium]